MQLSEELSIGFGEGLKKEHRIRTRGIVNTFPPRLHLSSS